MTSSDYEEHTFFPVISVVVCFWRAALIGGTDVEFVADSGATISRLIGREINTRSGATPDWCPSHCPL